NTGAFAGIYHPAAGPIMVHGRSGNDRLVVTEPDAATVRVRLNDTIRDYAAGEVTAVRFRGHAGDDFAQTAGTPDLLLGGSGNDELRGGDESDILAGNIGKDRLFGEGGFDYIYDGGGDDYVDVGPDGGEVYSTPGSDDIFFVPGDAATINFSLDDQPHTIYLDSTAIQRIDAAGNTVQLLGQWENYVGSRFDDTIHVSALPIHRTLAGGTGNNTIVIDATGTSATFNGTDVITFGNGGSITLSGFQHIDLRNASARIIDDSSVTGFSHTGFFDSNPAFPQGFNNGVKFSGAGSGNTATWSFGDLVPGTYQVSATWTNAPDRASDSPFTLRDGDNSGTIVRQIDINQEKAPDDFSDGGFGWEILGIVDVTGSSLTVQLTDSADEFIVADAIRIEPLNSNVILDDSSTQFTFSGGVLTNEAGLSTSQRIFNAGAGSTVGTWTTTGLTEPLWFTPGLYRISATWKPDPGAATNSPFQAGNGTTIVSQRIDQSVPPDDVVDDGVPWETIGTLHLDSFFDIIVNVTDDANGPVIADAIRIEPIAQFEVEYRDPSTDIWNPLNHNDTFSLGTIARDNSTGIAETTAKLRIINTGVRSGSSLFDNISVSGTGFMLQPPPPPAFVPPGGIAELEVEFAGSSSGSFGGSVTITPTDPLAAIVNLLPQVMVVDDSTPPTVRIVSPEEGPVLLEGTTLPVFVQATDDVTVRRVELKVDGDVVQTLNHEPWDFTFTLPRGELPPPVVPVEVTAVDSAGNTTSTSVDLKILPDAPPAVEIQIPGGVDPFLESMTLSLNPIDGDDGIVTQLDFFVSGIHIRTDAPDVQGIQLPVLDNTGPASLVAVVTDYFGRETAFPLYTFIPTTPLSFISPAPVSAPLSVPGGGNVQVDPVGNLLTPHIEWNPGPGALSYDLFLRHLNTGASQHLTGLTSPMIDPALFARGNWRMWLRMEDQNHQFSQWSEPYDYFADTVGPVDTVITQVTTPPQDAAPTVSIQLTELSLVSAQPITVSVGDTPTTFEVFVRDLTAPVGPDLWLKDITSTQFELPQGLRNGSYRIWSRLVDAGQRPGPWSDPFDLTINVPVPAAPTVTAPAGTINDSHPVIDWDSVLYADTYDVLIRRMDRGQPDVVQNVDDSLHFTPAAPLPDGDYQVWVRARTAAGAPGLWSSASMFSILVPIPGQVTGFFRTGAGNPPAFNWDSEIDAESYEVWIRNLGTGQNPAYGATAIPTSDITFETEFDTGDYRAWVRAINTQNEAGPWSDSVDFSI
ncbi:MAG: hypothetical protein KDA96_16660, partial [Planctomycetaceae bacterium]|nr:hypothetical protein [Planctomycetaceae bacterium]